MATKKTSTKVKTKTTKTRSASAKTPVSSSKVNARTITKKVNTSTKAELNVSGLRRLHVISIGVFGLLAVFAFLYMKDTSYQTILSYLTRDTLTGNIVPATRHFYDVEIRWLVVATMCLSLVLPLLYLTKFAHRYKLGLQNKLMPWRWLDMGVTGLVMIETIALLSGQQDVVSLKLFGLLTLTIALLSWLDERAPTKASFRSANVVRSLLILVLATSALATPVFGLIRASWYVYALHGLLIMGFLAYAINHFRQRRSQYYAKSERNYLVLNLLSKSAFAIILIFGLMR